ncbi:hypothetical protein B0H15DRAFT_956642 [Mycena belliarum]|uniref:Uncharacterized protein n=1 Tax=Mycena belliarum TaxID=1033014 RepID=A0AAD6TRT7_9AGAR|nr:hypothetical protein B0H15DRAFT_956642 [Mycena belliae]
MPGMGSEGAPLLHPYLPLATAPLDPSRHRVLRSPTHLGIIGAASDTPVRRSGYHLLRIDHHGGLAQRPLEDSILSLKDGSILYGADPSFRAYEIEGLPNASVYYMLPINTGLSFKIEGTVTLVVAVLFGPKVETAASYACLDYSEQASSILREPNCACCELVRAQEPETIDLENLTVLVASYFELKTVTMLVATPVLKLVRSQETVTMLVAILQAHTGTVVQYCARYMDVSNWFIGLFKLTQISIGFVLKQGRDYAPVWLVPENTETMPVCPKTSFNLSLAPSIGSSKL